MSCDSQRLVIEWEPVELKGLSEDTRERGAPYHDRLLRRPRDRRRRRTRGPLIIILLADDYQRKPRREKALQLVCFVALRIPVAIELAADCFPSWTRHTPRPRRFLRFGGRRRRWRCSRRRPAAAVPLVNGLRLPSSQDASLHLDLEVLVLATNIDEAGEQECARAPQTRACCASPRVPCLRI